MKPEEFTALALDYLERLDTKDMEAAMTDESNADLFTDLHTRWSYARLAFPGMTWKEFLAFDRKRNARRGRPKASKVQKADKPLVRAARDVKRIRDLWRDMPLQPDKPPKIPADPIVIAARRHGVDEVALADLVRRPLDRR